MNERLANEMLHNKLIPLVCRCSSAEPAAEGPAGRENRTVLWAFGAGRRVAGLAVQQLNQMEAAYFRKKKAFHLTNFVLGQYPKSKI